MHFKPVNFIFRQYKQEGHVRYEEVFDDSVVDLSDISDSSRYNGGIAFVPNVAENFFHTARNCATADVSYCQGVGPQSYGTTFEVVLYDANHNISPLCSSLSVAMVLEETWGLVFNAIGGICSFDIPGRVTLMDLEKAIDSAYRTAMTHPKLFMDMLHIKKKMHPTLGLEKTHGSVLYEKAV